MIKTSGSSKMETIKKIKNAFERVSKSDFKFSKENVKDLCLAIYSFEDDGTYLNKEEGSLKTLIFKKIDVWYLFDTEEFLFKMSGIPRQKLEQQAIKIGTINFNKNKGSSLLKDAFGLSLYKNKFGSIDPKIEDKDILKKFVESAAKKFVVKNLKELYRQLLEYESTYSNNFLDKPTEHWVRSGNFPVPLCLLSETERDEALKTLIFTESTSEKWTHALKLSVDGFEIMNQNLLSYTKPFEEYVKSFVKKEQDNFVDNLIPEIDSTDKYNNSKLRLNYISKYLYSLYTKEDLYDSFDDEEKLNQKLESLGMQFEEILEDTDNFILYLFKELSKRSPGYGMKFLLYILDDGYYHLSSHISKHSRVGYGYGYNNKDSQIKSAFNKISNHVLDFIEAKIDSRDDLLSEYVAFEESYASKKKERHYYGSRAFDPSDLFVIKIKSRYKDESLKVVSSFKVEKKLKYESTILIKKFDDYEKRILQMINFGKELSFSEPVIFGFKFEDLINLITVKVDETDDRVKLFEHLLDQYKDNLTVLIPDGETSEQFKKKIGLFSESIDSGLYDEFESISVLKTILKIYLAKI
jgi:hypothetical protein